MRNSPRRPAAPPAAGFTIVELLVVISIMVMLVGLLLPAVQGAREGSRRSGCLGNQRQLALGAMQFAEANGLFPGYLNQSPNPADRTMTATVTTFNNCPSWPVMVMPFIERVDVFRSWANGVLGAPPYVPTFVCPSSPPDAATGPVLAYAGNAGAFDHPGLAAGVLADAVPRTNQSPMTAGLSSADLAARDGATQTLLLCEMVGSGAPAMTWNAVRTGITGTASRPQAAGFGTAGGTPALPVFGILAPAPSPLPKQIIGTVETATYAPSSNHPGGAVLAFADGRAAFVRDTLGPNVYAQLLSSDDAKIPPSSDAATWKGTYTVLNEADYR